MTTDDRDAPTVTNRVQEAGVTINVSPAYSRFGVTPPPPRILQTGPPVVRRYNQWGFWEPLAMTATPPHVDPRDPDVSAALWYRHMSRCSGIEFVAISTHRDDARFRTLTSGMLMVPVEDPDWPREGFPSRGIWAPPYFLYDGWLPVEEDGPEAARAAVATIQDTFDFFAYQYGIRVRWLVKYAEIFRENMLRGQRHTDDTDDTIFRDGLSRLHELPAAVLPAVRRAAHWHQSSERQERKTDRFLALWLAVESLVLVLYEHCGPLGLVVLKEEVGLGKSQRRDLRDRRVLEVLAAHAHLSPSQQVEKAYFDGVVGIGRRVKAVLSAVFESAEHGQWLYSSTEQPSPAELRSKIVHDGWSEQEALSACPMEDYCDRLSLLLKELIERVLFRSWGGTYELRQKSYSTFSIPENALVGTAVEHVGDFRISLGLLVRKSLIDVA